MQKRKQRSDLPDHPVVCVVRGCVYKPMNHCDCPRINKGNSDAACHEWSNVLTLTMLRDEHGKPLGRERHTQATPA